MNRDRELAVFLAVTFGLTYIVEFIALRKEGILDGGYLNSLSPELTLAFQLAMFIPALTAITSQLILNRGTIQGKARWFINYYFIMTAEIAVGFVAVTVLGLHEANPSILPLIGSVTAITGVLGTVLLLALHGKQEWRKDLEKANLNFGSLRSYVTFGGFLVVFLTAGAYIDLVTGLGYNPGADFNSLILGAITTVLLGPIMGITTGVFGEEYGWRIYLQDLLTSRFGKVKGVLLLGVVWGLWHAPAVLAGWTYPGYGLIGLVVFTLFTTILGVMLSHGTMVSGTVWLAAYLHAIINSYGNYTLNLVKFNDPVYNFRLGIYGLTILGVCTVWLVIRNKKLWEIP